MGQIISSSHAAPSNPGSQMHTPLTQSPLPEQSFGHFGSEQSMPVYSLSHRQASSIHFPLPEQKLENYIYHRKARHQRVLDAVAKSSNLEQITKLAYENTPDAHPGLALDQTLAHLFSHEKEVH